MDRLVNSERLHYIDWLRVLAVMLLFPFHTARVFNNEDFYVKNEVLSRGMDIFISFVHQWHMPLFFLVSGVGTWFALRSRTGGSYLKERVKRLVVPLLFGSCVIVPPQVYLMRVGGRGYGHAAEPMFRGSYFEFYPRFFNGIPPEGNWEWAHLWFLAYLFTFSVVALPIFHYLKGDAGKRLISRIVAVCERRGGIFAFAVPLVVIEAALRPIWPGFQNLYNDWANFLFYLTFFVYGYVLCADARFGRAIEKHGRTALVFGVTCVAFYLAIDAAGLVPGLGYSPGFILLMVLRGFNAWFWLVAILWLGQRYLNFTNKALRYSNDAVLPVYVLHQTVIVVIAYYVVPWQTRVFGKFLFITAASLVGTFLIYDIIVRRTGVTRFLFGMRMKRAAVGAAALEKVSSETT
ncbi:MAG: hypothetical protein Kow0099_25370 [Candidatus Abyssubacteria bacterium]